MAAAEGSIDRRADRPGDILVLSASARQTDAINRAPKTRGGDRRR
jgi:hypothetical protein